MDNTIIGSDRTRAYRNKVKDLLEKSPHAQYGRFKEAARDLSCDDDEVAFDEKLKVIARQKDEEPK